MKSITTEELDRICNKYNLIHAPVSNYIKDIPEKNVLEMKNCNKLEISDKCLLISKIAFELYPLTSSYSKEYVLPSEIKEKDKTIFTEMTFKYSWHIDAFIENHLKSLGYDFTKRFSVDSKKIEKIDKSGLFIVAPKSHFNLEGLDKKSKFGFFKVEILEVKDPVVFEYCKEGIVRIISRWGTEDDQAYLDPILQNEILN